MSTFEKKGFLPLENLKTLKKFSKIAKNEVKAVKVAVLAAPHDISATPNDVLDALDTHGKSGGLSGPLMGGSIKAI